MAPAEQLAAGAWLAWCSRCCSREPSPASPGIRGGLIGPAGRVPQVGVTEVEVRDDFWEYFDFTPSVIEVPAGSTVTRTFTSRMEHNVVFDGLARRPRPQERS